MEKGTCWALCFLHTAFFDIPVGLMKTITERQIWHGRENSLEAKQLLQAAVSSLPLQVFSDRPWIGNKIGKIQVSHVDLILSSVWWLAILKLFYRRWFPGMTSSFRYSLIQGPEMSLLCFCSVSVSPSACLSLLQPHGHSIWLSLYAHIPKPGAEEVCVPSFLANSLMLTLIRLDWVTSPSWNNHYGQRDEIDCFGYLLLWNKLLQNLGIKTTICSLFSRLLWVRNLGKLSWVARAWDSLWTYSWIY